ncbi:g5848 [Coccomyxa viridis]|uniref:G5848 protein n=1 Tax=Coccomyxa viridis TaxID=1274662 RepID=A0ABP1FTU6_9CHLO
MERVEALLKGLGRGVQDVVALHTMTIVEEALEEDPSLKAYTLFDFLPMRATSPVTAASLLAGGKWPGLKRERQLRRIPKHRCKLIGEATVPRAVDAARRFNGSWDSDIQLLRHDCHHHTAELVRVLTGEDMDVWKLFPLQQTTIWI